MGRFEGRYHKGLKCPSCGSRKVFTALGGAVYECDACTNFWSKT